MRVRASTTNDLLHVADNMWQGSRKELEVFGVRDLQQWVDYFRACVERDQCVTIVSEQGEPLGVLAWVLEGATATTSFATTHEFIRRGKAVTKALIRAQRALIAANPEVRHVYSHSASDNPDAEAWFHLLGMALVDKYHINDHEVLVWALHREGAE